MLPAGPTIDITTTTITQADQLADFTAGLDGPLSTSDNSQVEIQTGNGQPFVNTGYSGNAWHYDWLTGLLDGETVAVTARVTDGFGRVANATKNVYVDVAGPSEVDIALSAQDGGNPAQSINGGDTVRYSNPKLLMDWNAATDGSGVASYYVGFTTNPIANLGDLNAQNTTHYEFVPNEATIYYAHLVSVDNYGNRTIQSSGPIYVDAPTTPEPSAVAYKPRTMASTNTTYMILSLTVVAMNTGPRVRRR